MNDKKKNIICFILIEVVTAVLFLIIGSLLPFVFGVSDTSKTVVEYVPVNYTITSTTSTTTTAATTKSHSDTATTVTERKTTVTTKSDKLEEAQVTKKINLNTATMEELMSIKGIGETYARRIIEFRDAVGGFSYMEQLMEIEGIGEGRYNAWTPYLTLDN